MNTINTILGVSLILALIYIIFSQGCNKHKCAEQEVIYEQVDTVEHITVIDTVFREVEKYIYITVNVPTPYYDTIPVPMPVTFDDIAETNFDYMMKYPATYTDTISNDTISLFYSAKVRGYLDNLTLGYKIFTPYVIKEVTTIQTEVTKKKAFNGIYGGFDIGVSKLGIVHFSPTLEASGQRFSVNIGYDVHDKAFIGGVKTRIRLKRE